jgi:hypothetical protein
MENGPILRAGRDLGREQGQGGGKGEGVHGGVLAYSCPQPSCTALPDPEGRENRCLCCSQGGKGYQGVARGGIRGRQGEGSGETGLGQPGVSPLVYLSSVERQCLESLRQDPD